MRSFTPFYYWISSSLFCNVLINVNSNMICVFVYIDNEQKYRCYLADTQRYYFLARTYNYRSVFLAVLIQRK